jgi:acyl-CoA reductase-like NAD-dependent aldehyde dehydrogenase
MRSLPHSIVRNVDVAGPGTVTTINPATEEAIATVTSLDGEGALDAVAAAEEAFEAWSHTPVAERVEVFRRWLAIMLDEQDELARIVSAEGGKPLVEARLVDVFPALETLKYFVEHLEGMLAFKPVEPEQLLFKHWKAGYRFDPLGVLAVVTPWNYPVGIPMAELVPAIGAGNTIVFKPASATVLTGLFLGDQARRAGLPPGVLNTVVLPGAVTDVVVDHPSVCKVLFTGSVDIGRHVAHRCAERLIPVQLELGGKDAAVVAADADLERTARGIVWGAFVNSGQTCASIERVYVERPLYQRLLDRMVELTSELKVGPPTDDDTDLGPLTTRGQRDIVDEHVRAALAAGAKALTGGKRPEGKGFYYPPTILVDTTDDMDVIAEETFGPVMPVIPVDSLGRGHPPRQRLQVRAHGLRLDHLGGHGRTAPAGAGRRGGHDQRPRRGLRRGHRHLGRAQGERYRSRPRRVRTARGGEHQVRGARCGKGRGGAMVLPVRRRLRPVHLVRDAAAVRQGSGSVRATEQAGIHPALP